MRIMNTGFPFSVSIPTVSESEPIIKHLDYKLIRKQYAEIFNLALVTSVGYMNLCNQSLLTLYIPTLLFRFSVLF